MVPISVPYGQGRRHFLTMAEGEPLSQPDLRSVDGIPIYRGLWKTSLREFALLALPPKSASLSRSCSPGKRLFLN